MCGVVGIVGDEDVSNKIYYALHALQHRGQESAGIAVYNNGIKLRKGMGTLAQALTKIPKGNVGIGHVRYSTTGPSIPQNSQPLVVGYHRGEIAVAHNGNLVNYSQLRSLLESKGGVFHTTSDTEVIAQLLARALMANDDPFQSISWLMDQLLGSYSLTMMINDQLIGVRDPLGFRPLCLGELDSGYILASETVAIDALDGAFLRDVRPGEALILSEDGIQSKQLKRSPRKAHCVFEYIYFARPDSVLDGRLVYQCRYNMGERLALEHPVEADLVSPVPDSGTSYALGFSSASGIKYLEALIKNRYIGRTFILPEQSQREISVHLKLNAVKPYIQGKRVVLVDDSIVRGTTSSRIVRYLKSKGAHQVHLRVGSPPIISPCRLGIDMATRKELIAANHTLDEIREKIGADSLGYLSLKGLVDSIGIPECDLCLGCLTGNYPITGLDLVDG